MNKYLVKLDQRIIFNKNFRSCDKDIKTGAKKVFMPGCSLSSSNPHMVKTIFEFLNKHENISFFSICCGAPSKIINDDTCYKKYSKILNELLVKGEACEVITACQSCYKQLKSRNLDIKVTSLWEYLQLLDLPNKNKYLNSNLKFSLHDSCSTRDEFEIQNSVRKIIKHLGIEEVECKKNGKNTVCCGAKMYLKGADKNILIKHINKRANEVDSDIIISYCQSCARHFNLSDKQSVHLLELIFNEKMNYENNFASKYKNIYMLKKGEF